MSVVAAPALPVRWHNKSALPGFGLTLGFTLFYLSAIVLVPLTALLIRPWSLGIDGFLAEIAAPRVIHALELSFGASAIAAAINSVMGLLVAWVLVRYRFPLHRLVDAIIDLPFALPTAVAGIALSALYAQSGWIGAPLARAGLKVAYTPLGVVVALIFIGLPFVVRTIQPVLADAGREPEEAAATLGATRWQAFRRVVLPALAPALITGTGLAFARAVGEYGSVIFIAGNLPMRSEIAPLLIVIKLEEYDYAGAASIGVVMLGISFLMLFALNGVQAWMAARK
ncbi:MAG TPA: sulfate ABC transporter permease subunit CysT [Rhizomicrobium sp.]|jgi:sulfate transport system permease protein|nr:sulfate ABC transporter permease subunit CysT [Rhizomicrobium sp.]